MTPSILPTVSGESTSTTSSSINSSAANMNENSRSSSSSSSNNKRILTGKESVCYIEIKDLEWRWQKPWQSQSQSSTSGTGFIISGGRILTCAHVVNHAIDVRVRLHGSAKKFPATVVTFAPDVDLALLEISPDQREEFCAGQDGKEVEFQTELPALHDQVYVCGYPTGGKTICVTEGVVSRIDSIVMAVPHNSLLIVQIDAAINSGNSGGPCYCSSTGKVVGVAFAKQTGTGDDNIGYIISSNVVRAFLGRIEKDGTYTVSPSTPYFWRALENKSLRLAHKIPDNVHGVLLTSVSPTVKDFLQKGDVLTAIDDHAIADDGQVVLRGDELIQHRYLLRGKHINEETYFTVLRDGQSVRTGPCVLSDIPTIYHRWPDVDHQKDYLILGALVLLPMSKGLMGSATTELLYAYQTMGRKWPGDWDDMEELVILTEILAHEISFSYSMPWRRVTKYNGTSVKSLRHLRDMWDQDCASVRSSSAAVSDTDSRKRKVPTFARIELEHDDPIIFEIQAVLDAQEEILNTHQIPNVSSINPPNPKYKFGWKKITYETATK